MQLSESSNENDDNVGSELEVGSDEDAKSDSEGLQDCEIVESPQNYNKTDARTDAHHDKGHLHNIPSESAVSTLVCFMLTIALEFLPLIERLPLGDAFTATFLFLDNSDCLGAFKMLRE